MIKEEELIRLFESGKCTRRYYLVEGSVTGHCCFEVSLVDVVQTSHYHDLREQGVDLYAVAEFFDVSEAEDLMGYIDSDLYVDYNDETGLYEGV